MKNKIWFLVSISAFLFLLSACSGKTNTNENSKDEARNLMVESSKQIEEDLVNLKKDIKEKGYLIHGAVYNLKNENDENVMIFLYYTDKSSYEGNPRGDSYIYKNWTHAGKKVYAGSEKIDNISYYEQIKKNNLNPIVEKNDFSLDYFIKAIQE